MPIVGHGVDIVEVARIAEMRERHTDRFLERCFTRAEQAYAADNPKRTDEHLAGRFAAKEAALKAIGTGWRSGIAWTDLEIVLEPSGAPRLRVTGRAGEIARDMGVTRWHVYISHTDRDATAASSRPARVPVTTSRRPAVTASGHSATIRAVAVGDRSRASR